MSRLSDTEQLARIRQRYAALDGAAWRLGSDGDGMVISSKGRDGSLVSIIRFDRAASTDEMDFSTHAPDDVGFLLGLVDRAIADARARRVAEQGNALPKPGQTGRGQLGAGTTGRDYTTEAAMLCTEGAFKRFLMDNHGLESPATDERTAAKLRSLLGVTSRKEINESEAVQARWKQLRARFREWKGQGG